MPSRSILCNTEIWGHVLFWSCLLTTLLYLLVGVACGVCLRVAKKAVNFALPIVYLGYAALKIVSTDAIASEYVCLWYVHEKGIGGEREGGRERERESREGEREKKRDGKREREREREREMVDISIQFCMFTIILSCTFMLSWKSGMHCYK